MISERIVNGCGSRCGSALPAWRGSSCRSSLQTCSRSGATSTTRSTSSSYSPSSSPGREPAAPPCLRWCGVTGSGARARRAGGSDPCIHRVHVRAFGASRRASLRGRDRVARRRLRRSRRAFARRVPGARGLRRLPVPAWRAHALRTIGTGALALLATLAITTAYHLGYPDFRGSKLTSPMRGSVIWAAPTLLTLNPIGSVTAHVGLHVAAVVHSYDGTTFLPPHANATAAPTIELHPCLITTYTPAKCGTLIVAENPADPGGPHIGLNVASCRPRTASRSPIRCSGSRGGAAPGDRRRFQRHLRARHGE